jgi:hypothetical protein
MPSPSTTDLPRPKSWDEFEDMCADVLKRLWQDPYAVRNGRQGQRQHGVDVHGQPAHLGGPTSDKWAGAQCKETESLDLATVQAEVGKARAFRPDLSEYLVMTTAARDAKLQQDVRTTSWPFPVRVMFWDDISLELSGHDDLLQKHFPGWMRKSVSTQQVLDLVISSRPDDFEYNDSTGVFVHKRDVMLRIILERGPTSEEGFSEPWVASFPDKRGTRQPVYINYGDSRLREVHCVSVDGGRNIIPYPTSVTDLTLSRFDYHIGCIVNHPFPGYGFDAALNRAGIVVHD